MRRKIAAVFFSLLAAACMILAVFLALHFRNAEPVLLSAPRDAVQRAEAVMEALCSGDYAAAEKMLYGTPDLGAEQEPEEPMGQILWQAYVESLDYELVGACYPTDTGLAQDVKIISMELPAVTAHLGERTRVLLNQRVENARDVSEIYDENNEYRQDLIQEVLCQAAQQALEDDIRYCWQTVTLQLVYSQGQWWVAADEALLNAVSGGTVG